MWKCDVKQKDRINCLVILKDSLNVGLTLKVGDDVYIEIKKWFKMGGIIQNKNQCKLSGAEGSI